MQATKTVFVPYGLPPGTGSRAYAVLQLQADAAHRNRSWLRCALARRQQPQPYQAAGTAPRPAPGAAMAGGRHPLGGDPSVPRRPLGYHVGPPRRSAGHHWPRRGHGHVQRTGTRPAGLPAPISARPTALPCLSPWSPGLLARRHWPTTLAALPDWATALADTQAAYDAVLGTAPDPHARRPDQPGPGLGEGEHDPCPAPLPERAWASPTTRRRISSSSATAPGTAWEPTG